LRSGGAIGADMAFELSCVTKEIFLPWKGYNDNKSMLFPPDPQAYEISKNFHPNWNKLSDGAKKLMARNAHIILGLDLVSPVDFVVYCAPLDDVGNVKGGTGQGIRIANHYNIPTYNILVEKDMDSLRELYTKLECTHIMYTITPLSIFYADKFSKKQLSIIDKYVDMYRHGKLTTFSDDNIQIKRYFLDLLRNISI
jgi:hypothetical protein